MITTVVTSTVTSTVTSATTLIDLGVMLGLVAVIALVVFLCAKELAAASDGKIHRSLPRFLDVGIIPLIIAFAMIVIVTIVEVLA